jgi:hypothetical protein
VCRSRQDAAADATQAQPRGVGPRSLLRPLLGAGRRIPAHYARCAGVGRCPFACGYARGSRQACPLLRDDPPCDEVPTSRAPGRRSSDSRRGSHPAALIYDVDNQVAPGTLPVRWSSSGTSGRTGRIPRNTVCLFRRRRRHSTTQGSFWPRTRSTALVERRYFAFGRVGGGVLTVRFTLRGERVRIIGAGYWRRGRTYYEKANRLHR